MSSTSTKAARRRSFSKRAIAAIVLAGLAVLAVVGWQMRPKAAKDPYRTAAVEQGAITRAVSASGALEALVTVEVGSQISGQILKVLVDFNDEVKAGQTLAILDPQTYQTRVASGRAAVAQGEAQLRQAQATLANAQADYDRKKILVDKGFYSPSVLDQTQAAFRTARASVEAARAGITQNQASLRSAQVDLGRTTIVSPIDGVVVDRQIEPGQTVAASLQAPVLFRIAQDLSKVQVKISVDEADIGQVREGQLVKFTVDAFPDEDFTGVVTQVRKQPVTDNNVVSYTVIAEADNPRGNLLPGMTANADIVLQTLPRVLKVPVAALRWTPEGSGSQTRTPSFGGPPGMGGPPQQQRQQGGGRGGAMADLAGELGLDSSQAKTWEAAQAEMRTQLQAARSAAAGDRKAMGEARRKAVEAALAKLEPTLKPEQKTKLAALRATLAAAGGRRGAGQAMGSGVVYVLRDGKPVAVPVQTGATDGSFTQVVGALKAGDQVITGGGPKPKAQARAPFGGGGGPGGGGGNRQRIG
jgi:HlyD family secretion protein